MQRKHTPESQLSASIDAARFSSVEQKALEKKYTRIKNEFKEAEKRSAAQEKALLKAINDTTQEQNKKSYTKWIKTHILTPLESEINRLSIPQKTRDILSKAYHEIDDSLVSFNHNNLREKHNNISVILNNLSKDKINESENPVKDFFKALAGVLLSIPLLLTPWLSKLYRNTLWNSHALCTVNKLNADFDMAEKKEFATQLRKKDQY